MKLDDNYFKVWSNFNQLTYISKLIIFSTDKKINNLFVMLGFYNFALCYSN